MPYACLVTIMPALRAMPPRHESILQNFKSMSTWRINGKQNAPGLPFWQRNYYEHVIRSESELQRVRQYILDTPQQWTLNEENPQKGTP